METDKCCRVLTSLTIEALNKIDFLMISDKIKFHGSGP